MSNCLICNFEVLEPLLPWRLCPDCIQPLGDFEKTIYKSLASSLKIEYRPTKKFLICLGELNMDASLFQLNALAVYGRQLLHARVEMTNSRWASFATQLYQDDGEAFKQFAESLAAARAELPIHPSIARELAIRHYRFLSKHELTDLVKAKDSIEYYGIELPEEYTNQHPSLEKYIELYWANSLEELDKLIECIEYFLWIERCTHLPNYSAIRREFGADLNAIEFAAQQIIDSLGHSIPNGKIYDKLTLVLEELEVSWPHLINRVRANGPLIFEDTSSALTTRSILVRLLLAQDQHVAVQIILWPSPKLQMKIYKTRELQKLYKETVRSTGGYYAGQPNYLRGYVARSWKNRWRRDY